MKKKGRKTIITEKLINEIRILKETDYPIVEIAERTNVSRNTVYKVLKEHLGYVPMNRLVRVSEEFTEV